MSLISTPRCGFSKIDMKNTPGNFVSQNTSTLAETLSSVKVPVTGTVCDSLKTAPPQHNQLCLKQTEIVALFLTKNVNKLAGNRNKMCKSGINMGDGNMSYQFD